MNKLLNSLILVLCIIVAVSACDSSSTDEQSHDSAVGGSWELVNTSVSPPPTYRHCMAAAGNKVYLFGGDVGVPEPSDPEGNWTPSDQFWVYDITTQNWSNSEVTDKPSARLWHAMITVNDKLFLFGGCGENEVFGDTWEYDPSTETWNKLILDQSPPERCRHGLVYDSEKRKVYMFGGWGNAEWMYDLWEFDLATQAWSEIDITGSLPGGFLWPKMIVDSNKLIVFSGDKEDSNTGDHESSAEFWEFDLSAGTWKETSTLSVPEGGSAYCIFDNNTMLYLEGSGVGIFNTEERRFDSVASNDQLDETLGTTNYEMVAISENSALLFGGRIGPYPDNVGMSDKTWIFTIEQ